jgi:hypothetical protein
VSLVHAIAGLGLAGLMGQTIVLAGERPSLVPLQCRLGDGPWRQCEMHVLQVGQQWQLRVNGEQISFSHDGLGNVRMRRGLSGWMPVEARWSPDASLCWDGVCARGDLPLD